MKRIEFILDDIFTDGEGSSSDPRFKFQIGDMVVVSTNPEQRKSWLSQGRIDPEGYKGEIRSRRNGYPPPSFIGYWFPLYFVDGLGEIGENCLSKTE